MMICSKEEYKYYLKTDLQMTGISNSRLIDRFKDRRFKFYKSLRLTEYYSNCRKDRVGILAAKILRVRHHLICDRYQWTIPINVFGPGLSIVHVGTIVVSPQAKIGKNCRIHVCTNIGRAYAKGNAGAPTLGDNIYIGPGAKIFGPIKLGNNIAIGANSVVNASFEEGNCTIAGAPARKISHNMSDKYINYRG